MSLYPPRQGTSGAPARFRFATGSACPARPPCRMAPIVTAAALLCAPSAGAEPPAPTYAPTLATRADLTLDPVIVTATRSRTALSRTPASISVVTDTDLEEQQADNIKEALRYEPGVTVRRSAFRPTSAASSGSTGGFGGNQGINIRGLDGNRILLMEDGIRLPAAFAYGPLNAGRGDYADMALLRSIEILRGPASSLYGSDGLTGAVNFITKDPQDLLDVFGKASYFGLRSSYDSTDRSFGTTVSTALGGEQFQGMLIADGRRGHEVDNQGSNGSVGAARTTPNPQDTYNTSLLGKLVFKATASDTFKLTGESVRQRINSDALSAVTSTLRGLRSADTLENQRVSLDYDYADADNRWFQSAHTLIYFRRAEIEQAQDETNATSQRSRDNHYRDRTFGLSSQLESHFQAGTLSHKLVYGVDASFSRIDSDRSGTGPAASDNFVNKVFPDTEYALLGAFVQDEIRRGSLSIIPALRYDTYRLKPRNPNDPLYTGAQAGSSDGALSPKLALMYAFAPAATAYVQYARGFRTPTPDQVNNSFTSTAGSRVYYRSIGNPDLKAETSDTVEVGLRGKLDTTQGPMAYSVAAFAGRYRNFIDQVTIGGSITSPTNPLTYQYVNVSHAFIRGVEARGEWRLPVGVKLRAAAAYTRGTAEDANGASTPLNSINPVQAVFGVRYEPGERWFAQTDMTWQMAKSPSTIRPPSAGTTADFATPSSFVVDVSGGYRLNKHASLYLAVRNLFDRKVWNWSDVAGLGLANSTIRDAYTAPGRTFAASVKIEF
ncbi:TonB-dependent hemoglobin/transferrin/lactoferrin family receptor [Ralstonia syzygii]|uniref:Outer membrane hemin receptor signal peptide protein n=1 Tax=Ralstonia syzygii R24 TaxID=907261 RepID=G3A8F1_9RALS|nr:TonB-dependent hemoglobin/transferrin/lactoferrin family receptor [Ralstonia syzygii]CCA87525.1 outer membrane hemin receptor signal peptide protein [Ralstonia syzygii R24]